MALLISKLVYETICREISKRGALLLLTESTGEAFAGPSSAAQLKCLRQTPREQDGSHSPRTRSIIRTKEANCIKNLSQGSEGTGESISGLNSSSSCYDLSGSERWNETPIILFEASFSLLGGLIHIHTHKRQPQIN